MKRREFRSDTLTMPTLAMREAMYNAEVGDDVYEEDPTVNRLQKMAAEKLSKEAALFVSSGTQGNQCAIGAYIKPGDEIILAEAAHMVEHESGAAGALWGAHLRPVVSASTTYLTARDIEPRIRTRENVHEPCTGLVALENSLSDGTVMPIDEMRRVKELAGKHGIPVHLDGARIFNAAIALRVDPSEIAIQADSVMVCLSKGLGAPVGSLLLGDEVFIKRARKMRKMLGGGMRKAGVLAAPGIVALNDGANRLAEDHSNARLLAGLLDKIPGILVEMEKVRTNMVFCRVDGPDRSDTELVEYLYERGFNLNPPFSHNLRIVTSYEVNEEDVSALAAAIAEYMA
jgi:threonine aldolase